MTLFLCSSRSVKTTLLVVFAILAVGIAGFLDGRKSNATFDTTGNGNGSNLVESAAAASSESVVVVDFKTRHLM
jgi:hypothetical protein